jgi:hypothetical protein
MTQALDRALLRSCAAAAEAIYPRTAGDLASAGALTAYLAVVELELPASGVRRWLDWNRSDVDAACLEVEDLREDAGLDEAIAGAGAALRRQLAAGPMQEVADLNAQRNARAVRRVLELLVQARGEVVGHHEFGSVETARTAICAARKEIGSDGIRTIRGRGFKITEAGLRAARALQLGQFGEYPGSRDASRLPNQVSQKAAA